MIGRDGRPQQKSLSQILVEWVEFRIQTLNRRAQHRLGKVDERIHILEGRQLVLLNIDEVIRIIRNADEPRPALMTAFGLSERQADDILEIRLRQLARLEAIRIEQELTALRTERDQLSALLASESAMRRQLIREIEADAKLYGDARRTLIEAAQKTVAEVKVVDEPVTVIVSQKGWIRARQGHGHDPALFSFKTGDAFDGAHEVMTTDSLFVIGSSGRAYSVPVSQLPSARGDGVPLTTLVELESGTRAEHVFAARAEASLLLATRAGVGFVCQGADLIGRNKAGRQMMSLDEGDAPIRPCVFAAAIGSVEGSVAGSVVCLAGTADRARWLVFGLDEAKVLKSGGRGTRLIDLEKGETLLQVIVVGEQGLELSGEGRGGKPMRRSVSQRELNDYRAPRGRKGKPIEPRWKAPVMALPGRGQGGSTVASST
jgi:topoisomerase-4 subunit A